MNEKILIVEDDRSIRSFMRVLLTAQNYHVIEAEDGNGGITLALSNQPDIILLDLGLPDNDGLTVIREIRPHVNSSIIVVSARGKENDKVSALDEGADDYLTKPFNAQELLARIRVALRHKKATADQTIIPEESFCYEGLCVDFERRKVIVNQQEVHLTPIEYQVLSLLIKHQGKVLTYRFIVKEVWGSVALESDTQTLRVTMANLRRKIEADPARPSYIVTEIGIGYRFCEDPS